jgi:hypothetical protein
MKGLYMKKIIVFLLLLLTSQVSFSTDTSAVKYLPLAVGNKWVFYHNWWMPYPGYGYATAKITKDTVFNSKRYFYFTGTDFLNEWIRLDTISANLYKPSSNNSCINPYEQLLDSLASKMTDTFYHCTKQSNDGRICFDTTNFTMSGIQYKTKDYRDIFELSSTQRRYGRNIGFVSASIGDYYVHYYSLRGCVINGVVYGDTTLVGLQPISINIPEKFSLYQNYPNPFNPTTKIKFSLPHPSEGGALDVRLIIYDLLGKEVASLIPPLRGGQEGLQPGTYEVEWNASAYPSGVYFYTLSTNLFIETKRMVLIK